MTLEALGTKVGSSASYLSQLENGHREPRLSTVNQLAPRSAASPLSCSPSAAPSRRAELEVSLARIQEDPLYKSLRLPYLKPSARLDGAALEHIVTLFGRMRELTDGTARVMPAARRSSPVRSERGPPTRRCATRCAAATTTSRRSRPSPPMRWTRSATRAPVRSRSAT